MLLEPHAAISIPQLFAVAIDRPAVSIDSLPLRIFYKGRNCHATDIWGLELSGAKMMPAEEAKEAAARLEAFIVAVPDWMAYA